MAEIKDYAATESSNDLAPNSGIDTANTISQIPPVQRETMARLKRWYSDTAGTINTSGSSNAYTATTSRSITTLAQGDSIRVKFHEDNTGACTLNLNSIGVVSIKTARGRDPQPGLIKANGVYDLCHNGTNFVLVGMDNKHDLMITFNGTFPTTDDQGHGYSARGRTPGGFAAGDFTITSEVTWADTDTARRKVTRTLVEETLGDLALNIASLQLLSTNLIRIRVTDTSGTHVNPSNITLTVDVP